jgi:aminoglycoside phosphotransferase (APT) family kinase protein
MNSQALDIGIVGPYLEKNLASFKGLKSFEKFSIGQSNPTFLLKADSGNYVLRRKPPGALLKSAHAIDREFRVQKSLFSTDVPVAKMLHYCEDTTILGVEFYVMEWVDGVVYEDPALPSLDLSERKIIFKEINRGLAALHNVNIDDVSLSDYGAQGNYYERQISRWSKQYVSSETENIKEMDIMMGELPKKIPYDNSKATLVHGDFRLDNLIFHKKEPKLLAIIDWEISTTGHPIADLASLIMQWEQSAGKISRGLKGVDRDLRGLPSDDAFIKQYCWFRGIDEIKDFKFYLAFCFFRMAAVIQGVKKRALEGIAANPDRSNQETLSVIRLAKRAYELMDQL